MDEMLNNVGTQIQRAINEAINSQVLPQIQNVMMAGSGRETRRGWEVPVERSEANAEEQRIQNAKADCRNEQHDGYRSGGPSTRQVHDIYGGCAKYNDMSTGLIIVMSALFYVKV